MVRYEDLLQDLEPTMERILDFIEIKPTASSKRRCGSRRRGSAATPAATNTRPISSASTPSASEHDLGFVYDAFGLSGAAG